MLYSQIIYLGQEDPLGKVWLAAHWGDKKVCSGQVNMSFYTLYSDVAPSIAFALFIVASLWSNVDCRTRDRDFDVAWEQPSVNSVSHAHKRDLKTAILLDVAWEPLCEFHQTRAQVRFEDVR